MNYKETKELIEDRVMTPLQSEATNIKFPCTGFCYLAILNKENLIETYFQVLSNEKINDEYYKLINDLIVLAGKRKVRNKNIPEDGEYIDADTIKEEFKKTFFDMEFEEFATVKGSYGNIAINNIAMILFKTPILGHILINRSNETFLLIKLSEEVFFLIDSHQPFHGKLNFETCPNYITKYNSYDITLFSLIIGYTYKM